MALYCVTDTKMLRLCRKILANPLCDPQAVFQPTRSYTDFSWKVFYGIYNSYHLNGDDFIGRAAKRIPGLHHVEDRMPLAGNLIDHEEGVRSIRLKPRNPGKVAVLRVIPGRHIVLSLSASSCSLLPPSALSTVLHVPLNRTVPPHEIKKFSGIDPWG